MRRASSNTWLQKPIEALWAASYETYAHPNAAICRRAGTELRPQRRDHAEISPSLLSSDLGYFTASWTVPAFPFFIGYGLPALRAKVGHKCQDQKGEDRKYAEQSPDPSIPVLAGRKPPREYDERNDY